MLSKEMDKQALIEALQGILDQVKGASEIEDKNEIEEKEMAETPEGVTAPDESLEHEANENAATENAEKETGVEANMDWIEKLKTKGLRKLPDGRTTMSNTDY